MIYINECIISTIFHCKIKKKRNFLVCHIRSRITPHHHHNHEGMPTIQIALTLYYLLFLLAIPLNKSSRLVLLKLCDEAYWQDVFFQCATDQHYIL